MEHRQLLPSGSVLDNSYRIDRMIGAGGFGITYLAEDIGLSSRVCIKEYYPAQFGTRDQTFTVRPRSQSDVSLFDRCRTSFLAEARNLAKFDHPSIVRVLRVFEAYGTAYMVMKFEDGQSFDQYLRKLGRPPTEDELLNVLLPTMDALERLHSAGLIHRDIAPDNIMIRPDGSPVLLDFGSARRTSAELSQSMTGIVKAGYSPTEQYSTEAKHQGPWTDIYALGGTAYRAIVGVPPPESTQRLIEDSMVPMLEQAPAGYSPGTLSAIDACLRLPPKHRPQSISVLRQLLKDATAATQFAPQATAAVGAGGQGLPQGLFGPAPTSQPRSTGPTPASQPRSAPQSAPRPPISTPEVKGGAPVWVPIAGGLAVLALILGAVWAFFGGGSGTRVTTNDPPITRPGTTTPGGSSTTPTTTTTTTTTPNTPGTRQFTVVEGVQISSTTYLRRLTNQTLDQCRRACSDDAQCSAADFTLLVGRCDLYSGTQSRFVREAGYSSILSRPEEIQRAREALSSTPPATTTPTTTTTTTTSPTSRTLTEITSVGVSGPRTNVSATLQPGITQLACRQACQNDNECTAATYSAPLQLCELYSRVDDVTTVASKTGFFKLDTDVQRARQLSGSTGRTPALSGNAPGSTTTPRRDDGSSTPPTVGVPGAVQTLNNTGLEGDQIRTVADQTVEQCRALCEGNRQCVAADHSSTRRWCALYSRVTNQLNAPGITAFRIAR